MYEVVNTLTGNVFLSTSAPEVVQAAILNLDDKYKVKMPNGKMLSLASASWELENTGVSVH